MADHVLAIDQGTTSSRAIVFDAAGDIRGVGQEELTQYFPNSGWVEHDPEEIFGDTVNVCRSALNAANLQSADIRAIGITNQRETAIVWDRRTGRPIHNAIVWQDRRTAPLCRELVAEGLADHVQATTGLVVDSYFSGTKVAWILDQVDGARAAADRGDLAFGTVDSFLLWRLTDGAVHATDAANASRTMLYDIHKGAWDDRLLERLGIPEAMLPEVRDNSGSFGTVDKHYFGASLPITGMAGDQQAATFGQACLEPGMVKSTYGTGCFALLNTGTTAVTSTNKLLTTIGWRLGGETTYAIEGSIFVAGASVQWLRDQLGMIDQASDTQAIAESVPDSGGVYLVPAFTGLGAPHWDADARAALIGLDRSSSRAHIVRAALEAVAFQTVDLMEAMAADAASAGAVSATALRVDGGMVANDLVCQILADILGLPVERPKVIETTALGAAYFAGLAAGVYPDLKGLSDAWAVDRRFEPQMDSSTRREKLEGWRDAVDRVRSRRRSG